MKRIAFIEEGFLGSTLPLAKQLCKDGFAVDIYYLDKIQEPESTECSFSTDGIGITKVPEQNMKVIRSYTDCENLNLFLVKTIRPYRNVPVIRNIAEYIIKRQIRNVSRQIDKQGYLLVNIVANYNMDRYMYFLRYLNSKVVLSLHEVLNHFKPSLKPSRLVETAIQKETGIIVFSQNSYNNIININGIIKDKIKIIPFGLFEAYSSIPQMPPKEPLPEKYFLFYGYLLPYKGLSLIKEAVDILGDKMQDYKIVLAGKGNDPILSQVVSHKRFVVFSRFIPNRELAYIITNAYAVLCPYKTMSQSGIPQTTFVFNTPIIASDLEGFKEIIDHNNGIFFKVNDAQGLADAMLRLIEDEELRDLLSYNISNFNVNYPSYDWVKIKDLYKLLFLH